MLQRTSVVDHISINTLSFSSIFEIGDAPYINGLSRALAFQRPKPIYFSKEGIFDMYKIFKEEIPLPPLEDSIQTQTCHLKPMIKVGNIDLIGASASSIVQIGSSKNIYLESRVKHIRQLNGSAGNTTVTQK